MNRESVIVCIEHPSVELTDVRLNLPPILPPTAPRFLGLCETCLEGGRRKAYSYGKEILKPRNWPHDVTNGGTNA